LSSPNPLKARLAACEPCWLFGVRSVRHAGIVALAQASSHDAIYLDFQHGPMDMEGAASIFQAALHAGLTALARLSHLDPALIGRVCDAGAHGVMLADVRDADTARALVSAALLAPAGNRSLGLPVDPRFRGLTGRALMEEINRSTLLIAMIETEDGIGQAQSIADVRGIDALMIGSADLTAAMGIPGEYLHPRLLAAYERVALACRAAGKPFIAGGIRKPAELAPYLALGAARCYFTGSDTAFVLEGAMAARERAEQADLTYRERVC
jgi:2-keto-3-deoxy-L-rhamnonate aldolase RhmA